MLSVVVQPTITAGAYAAGDAVGGVLTFDCSGLDGARAKTGVIKEAFILDDDAAPDSAALTLHLFTDSAMAVADNAAFSVSNTDLLAGKYLGSITLGASYAATRLGSEANALLANTTGLETFVKLDTDLKFYGQLVTEATPTFNATDQLIVGATVVEY